MKDQPKPGTMDPVFTPNPSVEARSVPSASQSMESRCTTRTTVVVSTPLPPFAWMPSRDTRVQMAPTTTTNGPSFRWHPRQWPFRTDRIWLRRVPRIWPLGVCGCFGQRLDRGKPIGRMQWARRPCLRLALSRCGLRARERYRCWRRS